MNRIRIAKLAKQMFVLMMVSVLLIPRTSLAAEETVELGTTSTFAVLAATTITNTGATTIDGDAGNDIGLHPQSSITGFETVTMTGGTVHLADAVALQAKADLGLAYDDAIGRTPTITYTDADNQLGGKTLTTGVYKFPAATTANLVGTLILDAEGDPNAVFIFQATSSLVLASNSVVELRNGARYCRVFWVVPSDVTINTGAAFVGHIFALNSIWVRTGATVQGQLLARNGEVTLDANRITNGFCPLIPTPSPTPSPTPTGNASPTPGDPADIPATGDSARPLLWAGLAVIALTGLVIVTARRKRAR